MGKMHENELEINETLVYALLKINVLIGPAYP